MISARVISNVLFLSSLLAVATSCTPFGASSMAPPTPRFSVKGEQQLSTEGWTLQARSDNDYAFRLRLESELWKRGITSPPTGKAQALLVTARDKDGFPVACLIQFSIDDEVVGILEVPRARSPRDVYHTDAEFAESVAKAWKEALKPITPAK